MPTFRRTPRALAAGLGALLWAAQALGAPGAAPAAQDKRPLVAVLEPAGNAGVTPMNRNTARGTLQQFIVGSKKYRVVDRARVDQVLKEISFTTNGLVDNAKVKRIGKILVADYVCVTDMRKEDGYLAVVCSLIEVESGEVHASATEMIAPDTPMNVKVGAERAARAMLGMEPAEPDYGAPAPRPEPAPAPRAQEPSPAPAPAPPPVRDSMEVREAKATINRLMPYFSFFRDKSGVSCASSLLTQYEEKQRNYYQDKKNWTGFVNSFGDWRNYWWHSLFVEIKSGRLEAFSRYTYVNGRDSNNTLNHDVLAVNAGGGTISTVLAPVPRPGQPGGPGAFSAGTSGGVQREEGAIANEEVLRAIAGARGRRVQVELKGNQSKKFDLNASVLEGIAQTMELYNAIQVLEAAGVEIQKKY
jgi:TolB-like protein